MFLNSLLGAAGTRPDSEVSTPLPYKKLLLFVLDRIQKCVLGLFVMSNFNYFLCGLDLIWS